MFDNLSQHDQVQIFHRNVVMRNGRVVYVEKIVDSTYILFDLKDQKFSEPIKEAYKQFTPVYKRLGFINILGGVLLAARLPVRNMSFGFTTANTAFRFVELGQHINDGMYDGEKARSAYLIRSREFCESIFGEYPTLKQAIEKAEKCGTAIAFDRQFAINPDRSVFFRTSGVVGHLKPDRVGVQSITFKPEFQYLKPLLEKIHGKDFRAVAKEERIW